MDGDVKVFIPCAGLETNEETIPSWASDVDFEELSLFIPPENLHAEKCEGTITVDKKLLDLTTISNQHVYQIKEGNIMR